MSHTWIQPSIVAKEALRQLENNLVMGRLSFRGYEEEWMRQSRGWKVGSSVTIKAPVYFRVKDGATLDTVDLREEDITFTVDQRKHVSWPVTSQEMTLDIDKLSKRFLTPAMQALANKIDVDMLSLYKGIPAQVGTPGTTPSSWYTIAEAAATLDDCAVPRDNRHCVLDPWAQAKLADRLKNLLHEGMVGRAVTKGKFGDLAGFEMYMSQNVQTHTCGTAAGVTTILKDGNSSEGDVSCLIDQNGSWTKTFTQGDIFTIAAVNGVNPITGGSTGNLRQFVVEAAAGTAGNDTAVSCTPGVAPHQIYSASATEKVLPYQNVDALPADNAVVTVAGTASLAHKVNLAFHKDCLGLAMVPLAIPASVKWAAQESYKGYVIRVIRDYDVINDQEYIRFDVLYGTKILNPFLGCRIAG
jgi:hypothetical protein